MGKRPLTLFVFLVLEIVCLRLCIQLMIKIYISPPSRRADDIIYVYLYNNLMIWKKLYIL